MLSFRKVRYIGLFHDYETDRFLKANTLSLMLVSSIYKHKHLFSLNVLIALAPWFQPGGRWGGGGYLKVDSSVGSLVDFYNVQFYNR